MNPLEKIERSLEQLVEGVPRALFRHRLQPAELGRLLEQTMLRQQKAGVGGNLVPNEFRVGLGADDFEGFESIRSTVQNQMEVWLNQAAHRRRLEFVGPLAVTIVESESASRRRPEITSTFVERRNGGGRPAQGTQILSSRRPGTSFAASLVLMDTNDPKTYIVAAGATSIGRAPENDIILASADVSRHHARIDAAPHAVRIHDLRSTNGTRINGDAVSQSDLFDGDIVQFGGVRLRFAMLDKSRTR